MGGWRGLRFALAFAVLCAALAGTGAEAQEARGTRVAIIEMSRILGEASALRSIQAQGEAQRRLYAADAQAEAARLREVRDELKRQETLLEPATLEERQRAFNRQVRAADQRAQERSRLLRLAVQEGEDRFRVTLRQVVAEVAEERGIEVVVPVNRSLFAIAERNVTDEVIRRMNDTFAEITLRFERD